MKINDLAKQARVNASAVEGYCLDAAAKLGADDREEMARTLERAARLIRNIKYSDPNFGKPAAVPIYASGTTDAIHGVGD